jgi:hypothetical protein
MIRLTLAIALAGGLLWSATGPAPAQDAKPGVSPQADKINELIAKGWKTADIKKPAARATDHEFMRRVFIDLIGRIPTPEEITDFEKDRSANRRAKLVYRLLNESNYKPKDANGRLLTSIKGLRMPKDGIDYNDAYAQNFADLWTTWMLTRSNILPLYREQFHLWLTQQFVNTRENPQGTPWNKIVYDIISATGKGNDNGAVIFVIRHLGEPIVAEAGQKTDYNKEGKYDGVPITSRVTKLFLGIQSQCVQCHDHPFHKEYVQSDFWGVNAFFRQTDRSGNTNPRNLGNGVTPPQLTLSDVPSWNYNGMVLYERRDGQRKASYPAMIRDLAQFEKGEPTSKRLVSGNVPENLAGKTRRQVLAQWVIDHDNFARAFVNRMWGHLFGRGLNEEPAVDNFNSDNKVVHPELLDYLAEEFKKYNYDPKKLLEWICTSDVYNLSHIANKAYTDQKYDPYFARMPLKTMSPEVMFDSLAIATRAETRKDEAAYKALKEAFGRKLTQNFGDDEGNEINFNGTVVQALLMMNGREINAEIGSIGGRGKVGDGVVEEVVRRKRGNSREIYTELYLMTVSRPPAPEEIKKLDDVRNGRSSINLGTPPATPPKSKGPARPPKGGAVAIPGTSPDDVAFYQDVFWALLNSNEFILNH